MVACHDPYCSQTYLLNLFDTNNHSPSTRMSLCLSATTLWPHGLSLPPFASPSARLVRGLCCNFMSVSMHLAGSNSASHFRGLPSSLHPSIIPAYPDAPASSTRPAYSSLQSRPQGRPHPVSHTPGHVSPISPYFTTLHPCSSEPTL
jgi:hypothetical protein